MPASRCEASVIYRMFRRLLRKNCRNINEREERMLSMIYEKFLGSDLTPEEKMQLNAIDKGNAMV